MQMQRGTAPAVIVCLMVLYCTPTFAQGKAQPLRQQLGRTWTLVDVYFEYPDGHRTQPYAPNVKGRLVLDADGLYSFQVIGANRPKFASSNRREGTPQENAAVLQMTESFFGSYALDEMGQTVTLHLDRAMFPNWDEADRTYKLVFKGDQLLTVGPPTPSAGAWYIPNQLWQRAP